MTGLAPPSIDVPAADRTFARRIALFYGALFVIYAVHVPYLPVWLDWRGLTAAEIAAITASPFFVRLIVTPTVALLADHRGEHRRVIIVLAWGTLAMALLMSAVSGFWPLLAAAIMFALAASTIMPLTETIAMSGVRAGGLDYGRMRLWGSIAFIVFGFAGGFVIDAFGAGAGIWLIIVGTVATVVAAHRLPEAAGARAPARRFSAADVRGLLASPVFLLFLVAVGAVQGAHAMFYTFGALHWRAGGLSTAWVGALWAIGVLAEVAVFAASGAVAGRLGALGLIIVGAAAAVLRWGVMAVDPPLFVLIPLQLLHAATYAATHLGAMQFIAHAVPVTTAGTAQALYATVAAGIAMGGATLAAGALYPVWKGEAYLAMAALALLSLAAGLLLLKLWDGRELVPPQP